MPLLRGHAPDPHAGAATRIRTGPAPLAGRAQQRMGAGEQAPRLTLRPAWLHHPVAAAERMHLPGCKTPRSPILKTASKPLRHNEVGGSFFDADPQRCAKKQERSALVAWQPGLMETRTDLSVQFRTK